MEAIDEARWVIARVFGIRLGVVHQFEADGVFPALHILVNIDQKWIGVFRPAILLPEANGVHRDMAGVV